MTQKATSLLSPALAVALCVALSGCPKLFGTTGTTTPTSLGSGSDSTPTAGPASCEGVPFGELQIVDLWGRPLAADLEVTAAPTPGAEQLNELNGECAPIAWLSCGQTISGDNSDPNGGTTWAIDGYPVGVGTYDGGEVTYAFRAPASRLVEFGLVDPEPTATNQDLFVLASEGERCAADQAVARGFNEVLWNATAGETYFLVLDSFADEGGPFEARLDCGGPGGASDTAETTETTTEELEPAPVVDGLYTATISAPDYFPTTISGVISDGELHDVAVTGDARWAVSRDRRVLDGYDSACDVTTLYVGLDHRWFASSSPRPPRDGNQVDLIDNGEEAFASVYDDLQHAAHSVHWATWWWESDAELIRPDWSASEEEREQYTVDAVLGAQPTVYKRLLVSRLNMMEWMTIDDVLEDRGETQGDNFEVILQGNPTEVPLFDEYEPLPVVWSLDERLAANPLFVGREFDVSADDDDARFDVEAASYHQKMLTIDGEVAYVMGMNARNNDWDTAEHAVFEPRRMAFGAATWRRQEVADKEALPDNAPRKDYALRVEGPVVTDVDAVLSTRWDHGISSEEPYSDGATTWTPSAAAEGLPGGVEAQMQVTMPAPLQERSILESLSKAFAAADDYILIEDQYWRAPLLNEVLLETLLAKPHVKLVVITSEVMNLDPAAEWTKQTDQLFKEHVPGQYVTYTLKSFDWSEVQEDPFEEDTTFDDEIQVHLVNHSLHSKLVIVDDRYLSVGSANKNNRGMLYEGEANIAVLDAAWVREARRDVIAGLVGARFADRITDDFDQTWELLAEVARHNEDATDWWKSQTWRMSPDEAEAAEGETWPSGFLYPLELPTWSGIEPGPDAF